MVFVFRQEHIQTQVQGMVEEVEFQELLVEEEVLNHMLNILTCQVLGLLIIVLQDNHI